MRFDEAAIVSSDILMGVTRTRSPRVPARHAEAATTRRLYEECRDLRARLFHDLVRRHPSRAPADLLRNTQIILNRVLFLAFAEDRGLLPKGTIQITCARPAPVWDHFRVLFRRIHEGDEAERFPARGGGLFAPNVELDALDVTGEMCAAFEGLAAYDYRDDVSVDVLGRIFEQSISDLEVLRRSAGIVPPSETKASRRKAEGIFYTPAFVTRFLVEQTLGRVFEERWRAIAARAGTYEEYRAELEKIRVLDLACGSGAFLLAAFASFSREYDRVNAILAERSPGPEPFFDVPQTILQKNLFGIDLNAESVELTKLSLWLETAERSQKLVSLDDNIRWGNSIVRDPRVDARAFDEEIHAGWPEVFDVVLGNPPYVRQERLGEIKRHLAVSYRAYHGMADLLVYFFERGLSVLKPGGRLGFVVANKWLKSGYGEPLRGLLAKESRIETVVDFGHAPIFPDADTFPCIVTLAKATREEIPADHAALVTRFPREELSLHEIPEYVARHRYPVPQARWGSAPWSLEPPSIDRLMSKIRERGTPLSELAGVKPYRGILTGFNEAFLIDEATKTRLCDEDPRSAEILKKYVRGKDVGRWSATWAGTWLVFARRGIDITQYPAIFRHLARFRGSLEPRPKGPSGASSAGRKPGSYAWYELQDAAFAWKLLESPKIVYQEIQFHPAFAIDASGLFVTNKVFFLPIADPWILAVLNAPLMWWYCWRYLPHMKDETLSPVGEKMQSLPIAAPPSPAAREEVEAAVARLAALKKSGGASGRREALVLERRLGDLVSAAYGLTPEDVALLWSTAPPRMPVEPE